MEYGLWNFHGGFWPGGNNAFPPAEGISRNFYSAVNNEVEPPTFHVTTPANGDVNAFTAASGTQLCHGNLRPNLEFLSVKNTVPINTRVPPMVMPEHQDNHLQNVGLEIVPMASDLVTERNSMDSLAPTDSSMPPLLSHQSNPSNNSSNCNNNNNITTATTTTTTTNNNNNNNNNNSNNNNNNINNNNSNSTSNNNNNNNNDKDNESPPLGKKEKSKVGRRENEEVWEDMNGLGTNIKLENNSAVDYLFQPSYHSMYEMVFSRTSTNKREQGTSDETDEEDDEGEECTSQPRIVDSLQSSGCSVQDRSPGMSSVPTATSVNFSKSGYECGECGLVAETRPSLKKHIAVFHPAPNTDVRLSNALLRKMSAFAKCPMTSCRFRSSERSEMEAHMARHVTGGYKVNGKRRAGPLTPQRVRYEREEYRCQICAYSCTVEKAFYKHLKVHSVGREVNQVKISCVICGKDRSSEVDMNKHMKKHRDDRYFCCDICIFKTVQLKKLIQHRRMHTGEKPHLCPHCQYRSARRDNLRSHVRRVHKKDNLFCDTFSPRGLLLTSNTSTTTASITNQQPAQPTGTQQEQPQLPQ